MYEHGMDLPPRTFVNNIFNQINISYGKAHQTSYCAQTHLGPLLGRRLKTRSEPSLSPGVSHCLAHSRISTANIDWTSGSWGTSKKQSPGFGSGTKYSGAGRSNLRTRRVGRARAAGIGWEGLRIVLSCPEGLFFFKSRFRFIAKLSRKPVQFPYT